MFIGWRRMFEVVRLWVFEDREILEGVLMGDDKVSDVVFSLVVYF